MKTHVLIVKTQNPLQNHIENLILECQNTEFIIESRWKRYFGLSERRVHCKIIKTLNKSGKEDVYSAWGRTALTKLVSVIRLERTEPLPVSDLKLYQVRSAELEPSPS